MRTAKGVVYAAVFAVPYLLRNTFCLDYQPINSNKVALNLLT